MKPYKNKLILALLALLILIVVIPLIMFILLAQQKKGMPGGVRPLLEISCDVPAFVLPGYLPAFNADDYSYFCFCANHLEGGGTSVTKSSETNCVISPCIVDNLATKLTVPTNC